MHYPQNVTFGFLKPSLLMIDYRSQDERIRQWLYGGHIIAIGLKQVYQAPKQTTQQLTNSRHPYQ